MISPQRSRIPAPPRQADNAQPSDRRSLLLRARLFGFFILLLFAALISRLYYLQIVHGEDFKTAADANEARLIRTRAPRGTIVDINGSVLAANRSRFAVYATPDILKNSTVLNRLADLLHQSPQDIQDSIHQLQQNPYDPLRIALDVPMSTVTQIEENRPFLPGVSTEPEPIRYYPHGQLAAHLIGTMGRINENEFKKRKDEGYFNDDFIGKTGVEEQYEKYLHGTAGGTRVQIDARGRLVKNLGTEQPIPGNTVVLALDERLQAAAEKVFADLKFTGAAVAMNPQTGAVLAMVSKPGFDPNLFASSIKPQDWKPLNSDPKHPLINRAVDAMYPPGSTFKPIVAAAGLQTKAISTHSTAYCSGAYYLGSARFGCWQRHGEVDFYDAMAKSCDVFFYIAGQAIGPDRISYYAKQFGLAQHTGIDLPSEKIGSIPSPEWKARKYRKLGGDYSQWFGGDTLHMSIGQGYVLATPLQMARVCATVANGGDVLQPYVVQRVVDQDGKVVMESKRHVVRHVAVSAQNMEEVRKAMRFTVTDGTGASVNFPTVAVAAKTGSAQVHGDPRTHGWFIAFAPYDHPTIAIASVVEFGGHGATSAGRVARAIMETYFHLPITPVAPTKGD
jgi:penicillin-binding protein 2